MLETIAHFLDTYWYYGYLIIFLGMIIEGAGVALITSFLAQQGHLSILGLLSIMFAGTVLGSVLWYQLGNFFCGTKIGDWLRRRLFKNGGIFEDVLQRKSLRTLFVSKFIYGLDRPAVVLSGLIKLDFAKFFKIEIFTNAIWLIAVFSLGYSSGAALGRLKFYFKSAELIFLIAIVLFVVMEIVIKKKILQKIYGYLKQENNNF